MRAIIAMSGNRCIGKNGQLPWKITDDLKWFKNFTLGQTLIVGRHTFINLPPLKGRNIILITHSAYPAYDEFLNKCDHLYLRTVNQVVDVLRNTDVYRFNSPIIAGGKSIYEQFMPYIDEFYVSHINDNFDGDTFMFEFEHLFSNQETLNEFPWGKIIKYKKQLTWQ